MGVPIAVDGVRLLVGDLGDSDIFLMHGQYMLIDWEPVKEKTVRISDRSLNYASKPLQTFLVHGIIALRRKPNIDTQSGNVMLRQKRVSTLISLWVNGLRRGNREPSVFQCAAPAAHFL